MSRHSIEFSLTESGKEQVESNLPMVHVMVRKYQSPYGMDTDEWISEVKLVLCQAVAFWSPAKGTTLSSLFDRLVFIRRSNLNTYWKAKRASRDLRAMSLDTVRSSDGVTILHDIGETCQEFDSIDLRDTAETVLGLCDERVQDILTLIAAGLSFPEAGESMGYSRQYAHQLLKAERAKLTLMFPDLVNQAGTCPSCGGPIVKCTAHSHPKRCAACSEAETRKIKLKYWNSRLRNRKGRLSNV